MTEDNNQELDLNTLIDEFLQSDINMLLDHFDPLGPILDNFDNFRPEPYPLSEQLYATHNPLVNTLNDIPTDLSEWMIMDTISKRQRPPRLYEFLLSLLEKPHYHTYASYTNRSQGIFHIHEPQKVATLWEKVKSRQTTQTMTYDKFARAIRWYYKSDIMKKTNTRYTFQFSQQTLKRFMIDENNNTATYDFDIHHQLGELS